jgi:L-iditol 2-dehydrogenase
VAIVCTSNASAIASAAVALDVGGTLCLYAPTEPGEPLPVAGWDVFSRELTVTSSWSAGPRDMRAALALLHDGAVAWEDLIDARFDLDGTGAALEAQRSGAALKAVVLP